MTTPADTRISDERLGDLIEVHYPMVNVIGQEVHSALTELRERRAQAVTVKPPFDSTLADACLAMAKDIFARYFQKPGASEAERAGLATYLYKCATTGALAEYAAAPPPAQSADAAKEAEASGGVSEEMVERAMRSFAIIAHGMDGATYDAERARAEKTERKRLELSQKAMRAALIAALTQPAGKE